jgi:hypothetical protein
LLALKYIEGLVGKFIFEGCEVTNFKYNEREKWDDVSTPFPGWDKVRRQNVQNQVKVL